MNSAESFAKMEARILEANSQAEAERLIYQWIKQGKISPTEMGKLFMSLLKYIEHERQLDELY